MRWSGVWKDARTEIREPNFSSEESSMSAEVSAEARILTGTVGVSAGGTSESRGPTDTGDISGGGVTPIVEPSDVGGHYDLRTGMGMGPTIGGMGSRLAPSAHHVYVATETTLMQF